MLLQEFQLKNPKILADENVFDFFYEKCLGNVRTAVF